MPSGKSPGNDGLTKDSTLLEKKWFELEPFKGSNPCPVFRTLNGSHVEPLSYGSLKEPSEKGS